MYAIIPPTKSGAGGNGSNCSYIYSSPALPGKLAVDPLSAFYDRPETTGQYLPAQPPAAHVNGVKFGSEAVSFSTLYGAAGKNSKRVAI